jgi:hypothetical protein
MQIAPDEPTDTPMDVASKRLARVALSQPMNPTSAAVSAYVTAVMTAAKVRALCMLYVEPPNSTWTAQEALDAAITRSMNECSEEIEKTVQQAREAAAHKIQLVDSLPANLHSKVN